jgi:hypothetical protein
MAPCSAAPRIERMTTSPFLRTLGGTGVRVSAISVALLAAILGLWLVVALSIGAPDPLVIHPVSAPLPGLAR